MNTWLTLNLLLHLIAFAIWIGAMVFFLVVMGPAVHELDPPIAIRTLDRGRVGLETISWIAIALLLVTGIVNLVSRTAAPVPPGASYMTILGIKLFIFLAMLVHHFLQVIKYAPRIAAQTRDLAPNAAVWPQALLNDWQRWFFLLKINATLGPVAILLGLALAKG